MLDADGFELVDPQQKVHLAGSSVYVEVRKKPGRIKGYVQDDEGKPLAGVSIALAGMATSSSESGYFELDVPGDRLQPSLISRLRCPVMRRGAIRSCRIPTTSQFPCIGAVSHHAFAISLCCG